MSEFLEQLVGMFRVQAAAKGIDFVFKRPSVLPLVVYADEKRLRQVLINLLSNALKFTQTGSVQFVVHYRSPVAEFEIIDTGPGIQASDLLAVNSAGKIMWATPQAQKLLSDTLGPDGDDDVVLPEPIPQWLDQARKGKAGSKAAIMAALPGNEQLRLQYMGKLGANEFLLRLAKDSGTETPAEFSSELGLTAREGEVLSWLSKGKTNRDIAQILGLSPRTVDKHLEQIYSKLGVENRTAAAAIAVNAKNRKG